MSIERWEFPPIPESIPENIRSRMKRSYERQAAVEEDAWKIWAEHGWERVAAYGHALVKRDPRLNVLIGLGWLTDGISGAMRALDHHAQEQAREGHHDTAVVLRLLAISAQSCGPPGDPASFPDFVEAAAAYLDGIDLSLPTNTDWEAANVDAALEEAFDAALDPDPEDQ